MDKHTFGEFEQQPELNQTFAKTVCVCVCVSQADNPVKGSGAS